MKRTLYDPFTRKIIWEDDGPKLADLVEVVRCKDCKHYRSVAGYIDGYCHMAEWYRRYQSPDDYCSRGERKDDETY